MSRASGATPSETAIQGRARQILLSFTLMTIPMTLFSAVLLGLIFHYRIAGTDSSKASFLVDGASLDTDAIYVDLSATALTTVASWCSTVSPLLLTFALTLASYPAARSLFLGSQNAQDQRLPTPYQFALMLRITSNPSIASLWDWLVYSFAWSSRRSSQATPVKVMGWVLMLGSLLSALVFAADTWFHFATQTVALIQSEPFTSPFNASFRLNENCTNNEDPAPSCILSVAAANTFLVNGDIALALLTNVSGSAMVKGHVQDGKRFAYLGIPPKDEFAGIDYTASSLAVESACRAVTSDCFAEGRISGPVAFYKCSFAMEGDIETNVENHLKMTYFTNSSATRNDTWRGEPQENPYYYAAIASVNQNIGWAGKLVDEGGVITGLHGASIFALFCQATVYDLEYAVANSTITRFDLRMSNSSTAYLLSSSQGRTLVGNSFISQAASTAARFADNIHDIADSFGFAYSQAALAVAAAGTVPAPPAEARRRTQVLAAQVPKTPLGFLIASNLAMVGLGVGLTAVAVAASRRDEVRQVQVRLSIPALVAERFEWDRSGRPVISEVEELFSEKSGELGPRVTASRSGVGGWNFGTVVL